MRKKWRYLYGSNNRLTNVRRYERHLAGPVESRRKSKLRDVSDEVPQFTRSKTTPYDKDVCFFCDDAAGYRDSLHSVSPFSAGKSLRAAVGLSNYDKLVVKLNTAISGDDAHSIDIKSHLKYVGWKMSQMSYASRYPLPTPIRNWLVRFQLRLNSWQWRRSHWGMGRLQPCRSYKILLRAY